MKDTTPSLSLDLPNQALLFDLDELYACLQTIAFPPSSTRNTLSIGQLAHDWRTGKIGWAK